MERTSIWKGKAETSSFECLKGDIATDVAIIGGALPA